MKYDNIGTKELMKKKSDEMLYIFISLGVLEGVGYFLYSQCQHVYILLLAVFLFLLVSALCILLIPNMYFPKKLKERYNRDDVPDELVNWPWYDRAEVYLFVVSTISANIGFISAILKR